MPTFETLPRFTADLQHLTPAQRWRFRRVVLESFVPDLRTGKLFRPGLRVKGVRSAPGVYELTRAPDGRATWCAAASGIGTHEILIGPDRPGPRRAIDATARASHQPGPCQLGAANDKCAARRFSPIR